MPMTKKDFQALADSLKRMKPRYVDGLTPEWESRLYGQYQQWKTTVDEMCHFCRGQNGNFDSGRFKTACGYEKDDRIIPPLVAKFLALDPAAREWILSIPKFTWLPEQKAMLRDRIVQSGALVKEEMLHLCTVIEWLVNRAF